jgi:P27 family predicted phage terminase small subunit
MSRPRKPTAIKRQQGTLRQDRQHRPAEDFDSERPACPDYLHGLARREWNRITKQLHGYGLINQLDVAGLALYCDSYGRWQEILKQLREESLTLVGPTGLPVLNPLFNAAERAARDVRRMLQEFGLSPSARGTMAPRRRPDEDDELEAMLSE